MRTHFRLWSNQRVALPSRPRLTWIMIVESWRTRHGEVSSTGNSTFVAAKIIRFEVTRAVASQVCGRGRSESSFRALTTAVQPNSATLNSAARNSHRKEATGKEMQRETQWMQALRRNKLSQKLHGRKQASIGGSRLAAEIGGNESAVSTALC